MCNVCRNFECGNYEIKFLFLYFEISTSFENFKIVSFYKFSNLEDLEISKIYKFTSLYKADVIPPTAHKKKTHEGTYNYQYSHEHGTPNMNGNKAIW